LTQILRRCYRVWLLFHSEKRWMSRRVYVETYGCQMNLADSELITGVLLRDGYSAVPTAEQADVIVLNTCAVREKAEDRIFGRLGWLKPLKDRRPDLVLGVAGCMAEHLREELARRAPHVDIVVGPDAYRRLPQLISDAQAQSVDPLIDVRLDKREVYEGIRPSRASGVGGWISVARGCDKFCTFCIVPHVRGRERSLHPDQVMEQAWDMVAAGFKEVTLLGQTVSSYHVAGCSFADLLRRLHQIEGLARIRFTSPYPSDFDAELLSTLAQLPRVARHIHLPMQSGSSRILADMKRGYTAGVFRELALRVRQDLPEFSITTDVIVGYPSETEEDFAQTLALVAEIQFDSAFMFKYSARSGTWAAKHRADDVSDGVKSERLSRLIELQQQNCLVRNQRLVGQRVEVLLEGANPRDEGTMIGRSSCFRSTVLAAGTRQRHAGDLVPARVESCTKHTLFARALDSQ
jgi:tRNA-2-methylthio-N6-dimethylallyladenosine synthase